MERVGLEIDGRNWTGWTAVSVERGIGQAAGAFSLSLTTRQPDDPLPIGLRPGVPVTLTASGDAFLSGIVDDVDIGESARDVTLSVSGRSKTAKLLRGSAQSDTGEFRGQSLLQVARKLALPVGVEVVVRDWSDTWQPIPPLKLTPGESPFEAIERAARERACLVTDDPEGRLVLCRVGRDRADDLRYGTSPVLSWGYRATGQDRATVYRVIGQRAGTDTAFGADAAGCKGVAYDRGWTDDEIILTLRAEGQADNAACQRRANWEAAVRAGKATTLEVRVPGWRMSDGRFWAPNLLSRVVYPRARVDRDLLIASVKFAQDTSGEFADLSLAPPSGFSPEKQPAGVDWTGIWNEDWGF